MHLVAAHWMQYAAHHLFMTAMLGRHLAARVFQLLSLQGQNPKRRFAYDGAPQS
jgi:hypothetical protein